MCSTATPAESGRQQIRMMAKIDHLLSAHRVVCPGCLTDRRTAPGSVILPGCFFILRPRAPHESANGTTVAAESFITDTHAGAPHFSSLTFLKAFRHLLSAHTPARKWGAGLIHNRHTRILRQTYHSTLGQVLDFSSNSPNRIAAPHPDEHSFSRDYRHNFLHQCDATVDITPRIVQLSLDTSGFRADSKTF
jgi:hypothetical protein